MECQHKYNYIGSDEWVCDKCDETLTSGEYWDFYNDKIENCLCRMLQDVILKYEGHKPSKESIMHEAKRGAGLL